MVDLYTDEARQDLERSVAEAEEKTSTEIVVMAVRSATDYRAAEFLAAAVLALAVPALLLPFAFIPAMNIWIVQLVAFAGLTLAFRAFGAGRFMVGEQLARDVRAAAEAQFFAHGLRRTRRRAAVLVFVALQEHRVEILCDDAAAEAVGDAEWDALAGSLAKRIKAGEAHEGMKEAAGKIAGLLAPHFPPDGRERDELPNVILG